MHKVDLEIIRKLTVIFLFSNRRPGRGKRMNKSFLMKSKSSQCSVQGYKGDDSIDVYHLRANVSLSLGIVAF